MPYHFLPVRCCKFKIFGPLRTGYALEIEARDLTSTTNGFYIYILAPFLPCVRTSRGFVICPPCSFSASARVAQESSLCWQPPSDCGRVRLSLLPQIDPLNRPRYTLIQVFSKFGKIARMDYLFHKTGALRGKPRGYAFVEYTGEGVSARPTFPSPLSHIM